MSAMRTWWCSCLALLLGAAAASAGDAPQQTAGWLRDGVDRVSTERMMADIRALSSEDYLGRQTGTAQDRQSALFIADRFAALRLHGTAAPTPDNPADPFPRSKEWQQTSPVTVTTIQEQPILRLNLSRDRPPLQIGSEFLPVLDAPSAEIRAPIVFVGYGLSDAEQGHDDYAAVEVKNKVVLFLRGKPEHYAGPATHADKERLAKARGAAAYLTATGPLLSPYEQRRGISGKPSAFYSGTPEADRLPGAWISAEVADAIVRNAGTDDLKTLQGDLAKAGTSRSRATGVTASMQWDVGSANGTLYNVASIIRGSPAAEDAVIIGAHRDHFGRQAGLVFPGADDNASGTAVMLEVARLLLEAPASPKRSIMLLSFSGEEQGLLGSRFYTTQPIVPLAKTVAMINVDHAGVGNGRLTVGVTGLDKSLAAEAGQSAGLSDKLDLYGFFPGGDHVPFKEAGVPTITVVSGGAHPHFHQPSDTADTIDPEILRNTARYVLTLAWQLANAP